MKWVVVIAVLDLQFIIIDVAVLFCLRLFLWILLVIKYDKVPLEHQESIIYTLISIVVHMVFILVWIFTISKLFLGNYATETTILIIMVIIIAFTFLILKSVFCVSILFQVHLQQYITVRHILVDNNQVKY